MDLGAWGNLSYISFAVQYDGVLTALYSSLTLGPPNIKLNFEEGNDNEEADNNLHFIGTDVDRSC